MRFFRRCIFFFVLCLSANLSAQLDGEQFDPIEAIASVDLIEVTLEQAEDAYANEEFLIAGQKAKEASIMAKSLKEYEWQAKALQLEARSNLYGGGRKLLSARLLRESIELTNDPDLKLENLNFLRYIAIELRRGGELEKISKEILELTGGIENADPRTKKRAKEALKDVSNENNELTNQLASLEMEQLELMKALEYQETAIDEMNEEQAKVELLLAQQKMILDSLEFTKMADSLLLAQQEMELDKAQMELREQEAQLRLTRSRQFLFLSLALLFLLGVFAFYNRSLNIKRHADQLTSKNIQIEGEKTRSDNLLLNILPASVAQELKNKGAASTRTYETVSVLFTDFRDFTKIADGMDPEDLVADLDYCFKGFDEIVEKHGLEKIKTIGDSYMCAGGIPEENPDHPKQIALAALEMQAFLNTWKTKRSKENKDTFEARIGIHSGPLVAGVVGSKKFAYDIWGSTVNLASRMESNGEVGKVNVSEATRKLIADDFSCEYRGKVEAKNVGEVGMYFLSELV